MTDRLYYTDAYGRRFEATVLEVSERGGHPAVVLDRTAFYPTSGGQPSDRGVLGGTEVLDVIDEGPVVHLLSSPLLEGSVVEGEIDWTRRFDHMQQHTGQHLLSAAFDRLFQNPTVGFHMGAESATIDLRREATPRDIERAIDEANLVVWEDRPVSVRFVSLEEAMTAGLRKEPTRAGPIRLVEVLGFDVCACGGTHVARTGAVGLVAALGWERQRGGTRLAFVCGGRALRVWRTCRDAIAAATRTLSVLPEELATAVQRVQAESRALHKQVAELRSTIAAFEGARLLNEAPQIAGIRVVVATPAVADASELKQVAVSAVAAGGGCAAVISPSPPVSIAIARAEGVPLDAQGILRGLLERFGGRGGGRADLAQGGGLRGPAGEVAAAARELIERALLRLT